MKIVERLPFVDPVIATDYAKQQCKAGFKVKLQLRKRADCIVTTYANTLEGEHGTQVHSEDREESQA